MVSLLKTEAKEVHTACSQWETRTKKGGKTLCGQEKGADHSARRSNLIPVMVWENMHF